MVKTVLIVGGSGFVGSHLALGLRDNYRVFATHHNHSLKIRGVTYVPCAVDNRAWMKRLVYAIEPQVLIYATGTSNMEWAETHYHDADLMHNSGAASAVSFSELVAPRVIYLSNAFVFEGTRGNYHEGDTILPQTVIGKSKVAGENCVKSKVLHYVILRSSPLLGRSAGMNYSFLDKLRIRLTLGQKVELPENELYSYAPMSGMTDAIQRIIESGAKNKVFHYGGLTKLSPYELAKRFAREFGFNPDLIIPRRSVAVKKSTDIADFSLNCSQLMSSLKVKGFILDEIMDDLKGRSPSPEAVVQSA